MKVKFKWFISNLLCWSHLPLILRFELLRNLQQFQRKKKCFISIWRLLNAHTNISKLNQKHMHGFHTFKASGFRKRIFLSFQLSLFHHKCKYCTPTPQKENLHEVVKHPYTPSYPSGGFCRPISSETITSKSSRSGCLPLICCWV